MPQIGQKKTKVQKTSSHEVVDAYSPEGRARIAAGKQRRILLFVAIGIVLIGSIVMIYLSMAGVF